MPEFIRRKRDGKRLSEAELRVIVREYTAGKVPDYQIAAFLMAVYFNGFDDAELNAWTSAMISSGQVLDLSAVDGTKVDKHSTGGVGDKISLSLAPAVAALGVPVPMISGRGLGHTGGTLDKLSSIPGFRFDLETKVAVDVLKRTGLFLIGQTDELAPADRKLYALRDVTGTVESIPLIASSIMSKKIAEGMDALVLDVKVGRGAFMAELAPARRLAETMVAIGVASGKKVRALLTDMNKPLGYAVGNALEVEEAIAVMRGEGPADTTALTIELGAEMLLLGGAARRREEGKALVKSVLEDGRALETFAKVVEAQGGDPRVCDDPSLLPKAAGTATVPAIRDGYLTGIDPMRVAQAALEVGAGRKTKEDVVDLATGVTLLVEIGDRVEEGEPLAVLHHNGPGEESARGLLTGAFEISDDAPQSTPLVLEKIGS